ncbi:hypothetical protein HYQ46_003104 [Verticillium longisporum]|nr:hypothetical protein HYQ46_003104 [Verticillium longisporum]
MGTLSEWALHKLAQRGALNDDAALLEQVLDVDVGDLEAATVHAGVDHRVEQQRPLVGRDEEGAAVGAAPGVGGEDLLGPLAAVLAGDGLVDVAGEQETRSSPRR